VSSTKLTRTQTANLNKKYEVYLQSKGDPANPTTNPLNLFSELNILDKVWFDFVKAYINKKSDGIYTRPSHRSIRG
jgi:hypothetical protein